MEHNNYKILAINFGSTSTKIAVYAGEEKLLEHGFLHSCEDMEGISTMEENAAMRKPLILDFLTHHGHTLESFDAVVGRGGLVHPIPGGTYAVNDEMLRDLRECRFGTHVCNLGGILAAEIGEEIGKPAFIVDPPVIDEMTDIAHLSGHPDFPRRSVFHALNQKAIAKRYAEDVGKPYDTLNLIVAHMGGGVTVGAHEKGKIVDVNNGLEGDGPYTAERPGSLSVLQVLRAAFEHRYGDNYEDQRRFYMSKCGMVAYTGTNDGRVIGQRVAEGDPEATFAYRGMAYQIAKEIGAQSVVLGGKVGYTLCAIVWGIAIAGIVLKLFWITCPKWLSSVLYIAMGWLCVLAFVPIFHALPRAGFDWLLAGGIIYTIGGVIYALKVPLFNSRHKNFGSHEIFHIFVMLGSACHFIVMYFFVAPLPV